ncbi:NAD-dependent protein deacetylase sirtuin-2 [Podila minutissima]|uniref:NAD-dependent protein deacetylase sirtuin-2 n=1 Tax=Podila minutissima TaxID=64525 RepID=A0A9P5VHY3_9FUNG|nr:NAD-dependent protein deacetylase sirtuin-2 [Podila minutissima]
MSTTTTARIPIKSRPLKPKAEPEARIKILKDDTIESIAECINQGKAKKIIVMTGAGISTAAGIKDFRSPGTGLYDDLGKYNLPFPEAVFDLAFFKETPSPFYRLAKELFPGKYRPTLTHYLLPLLAKKGLLLRSYTQNIDSLEKMAGLPEDLLVEAHGSFATSKCIQCSIVSDSEWVKEHIMDSNIPYCKRCDGLVKPEITFFGEDLPSRFRDMAQIDFVDCDLLIVLGTSLKVEPFNKLITQVSPRCPRLLINREKAGQELHSGFDFDDKWKYTVQRDAWFLGDCDVGVKKLVSLCGWEDELQVMYEAGTARLKAAEEKEEKEVLARKNRHLDEDDMTDDEGDVKEDDDKLESPVQDEPSPSLNEITGMFGQSKWMSQGLDEEEKKSPKKVVPRLEVNEPSSPAPSQTLSEEAPKSSSTDPTPEEPSKSDIEEVASEAVSQKGEAKQDPATEESKSENKDSKEEKTRPEQALDIPSEQSSSTLVEKVEQVRPENSSTPLTRENTPSGSSDASNDLSTHTEQISSEPSTPRSNSPFVFSRMGSLSDDGLGLVSAMSMPTSSTLSCIPLTSNDSSGPSMPMPFLSTCAPFSVWSSPSFIEPPKTATTMGSFQARRKRERDGDTSLKTVLRVPALAPHYLTCGRVTKRQRYV